jgi:hypothetical protein
MHVHWNQAPIPYFHQNPPARFEIDANVSREISENNGTGRARIYIGVNPVQAFIEIQSNGRHGREATHNGLIAENEGLAIHYSPRQGSFPRLQKIEGKTAASCAVGTRMVNGSGMPCALAASKTRAYVSATAIKRS